jgi:hypothetical protein
MSRVYILVIALCVGISCDINNSKSDVLDEVKDARDTWTSTNPQNYSFNYQTLCFCAFTDEVRIVVEADSVVDVQDLTTNETIMIAIDGTDIIAPIHEFYPSSFFSINEFFVRLEVQVPVADESIVEFDKTTGMPIEIYIDRIENAVDDEITYLFSNLTVN